MVRSRLSRKVEERIKRNLILNILGIILVILLIFKFGIPLLINISLFLSGSKGNQESQKQDQSFIAPPILDPFPIATSSANIVISGIASKNQTINLYINDNLTDTAKTKDNGTFSFEQTISTEENIIKTKVVQGNRESEFSNSITTAFKTAPPSLKINSPSDGQSFSKDQNIAEVKGATDAEVKITVNSFWAITDDNGNFSYNLPLQSGENKIKILATDMAGNKTEKELKVTYSP
ncbi:MAG: hypothetical protein Q7K54_05985 [Candidatus Parcubacteria bacterium]|nr:hypothetical protein [Candidatus Parcubacteria bacterium]